MPTYLDVWREVRGGVSNAADVATALGAELDTVHAAIQVLHLANVLTSTRWTLDGPTRLEVAKDARDERGAQLLARAIGVDLATSL